MSKDDSAVKEDAVAEPAPTESAPAEDNSVSLEDDETTLEELQGEETSDTDSDSSDQSDETKSEEPADETPQEQLAPKSENRFQKLANENRDMRNNLEDPNFLQSRLAELRAREVQFQAEQELLNQVNPDTGDYYSPQEAERLAFSQAREQQAGLIAQERYNLEVQSNQQTIQSEAEKALSDFPMFDEQSPNYNPTLAAQADQLLSQSLIFDQQGTLVGSSISPYQLYKSIADATQANAPVYQAQAQKATEKMLANADIPSGQSQASKQKVDPDLLAFDEEASRL